MSSYIVSREHIVYLVYAAEVAGIYWKTATLESLKLDRSASEDQLLAIAKMLWEENIRSVSQNYQGVDIYDLPGPRNENYFLEKQDIAMRFRMRINWLQVIKSVNCYSYQSCEHAGWENSEAKRFVDSLERYAIRNLPGYDEAEWGVPCFSKA